MNLSIYILPSLVFVSWQAIISSRVIKLDFKIHSSSKATLPFVAL